MSFESNPLPLAAILDSLDALVYVSDMKTHELLYINAYGRKHWGNTEGRRCWQVMQSGQDKPCEFCNNSVLLDAQGEPTGPQVWEFQNTITQRWYQCRDQAIPWVDGRYVRLEVATDITERKLMEEEIKSSSARARELALTDELTGANNRRAFFNLAEQARKQCLRADQAYAVIMLDADGFKLINDNFGHSAGDEALLAISNCLRGSVREGDIFGRIGGEEFAIFLPNSSSDDAANLAERLRSKLNELRIALKGAEIRCSASFGVAHTKAASISLEQLLSMADGAMYQAKRAGRNRVQIAQSLEVEP